MTEGPPNILLIHTDQQRTDSLSCYGSDFTHTPNLDRLADEGAVFDRAYCPSPVCTPSRMSLLTGLSVSRHGAWNVDVSVPDDTVTTIGHHLTDVGYRSHMIGKAHLQSWKHGVMDESSAEDSFAWRDRYPDWNGPYHGFETVELAIGHNVFGVAGHYGAWVLSKLGEEEVQQHTFSPSEWADWPAVMPKRFQPDDPDRVNFQGSALDWGLPTEFHNSVWTADRTIAFLEEHDRSRPFLLSVGFQDPHHPHAVPRDWDDRVEVASVPSPDWTDGELDDKPPHFRAARNGTLIDDGFGAVAGVTPFEDLRDVPEADERAGRAYYYTMVKLIDREIGRILATLDRLRLSENTLIIFTTDHGELLGDHGLWGKGPFHYEQLIRVPLIMRWPGGMGGGQRPSSLVSLVDVVPTCLAAAGLPVPHKIDGVDMLPLLQGEAQSVRDHVLVECIDDPARLRAKTVVTQTRKLTWYAGGGLGELYDLEGDPREKINRWWDHSYVDDKADLLGRIVEQMDRLEGDVRLPRSGMRHPDAQGEAE